MNSLALRIYHYLRNLIEQPLLKMFGSETIVLFQIYKRIETALILITILSAIDFITGLIHSWKKSKFGSHGLKQTTIKLIVYYLLIYLGSAANTVAGIEWTEGAFLGLIVTTELVSILENIELSFPGIIPRRILNRFGVMIRKKKHRPW
jgi:phage-related holin